MWNRKKKLKKRTKPQRPIGHFKEKQYMHIVNARKTEEREIGRKDI